MKLKLSGTPAGLPRWGPRKNLGHRTITILRRAGHDVTTVAQQNISGISDLDLIDLCKSESRALVTLDLDFANPLRFRPSNYTGIAVLRLAFAVQL